MDLPNKPFLGITAADQRRWLFALLNWLRQNGFDRVIVPCCGNFTIPQIAIKAGFARDRVEASDISFYSTVLGHLYSGQDLGPLMACVREDIRPADCADWPDTKKAAFLIWLMKVAQLRDAPKYLAAVQRHFTATQDAQVQHVMAQLDRLKKEHEGIRYECQDMRVVIEQDYAETDVVIVNPPSYDRGYDRMFDFGDCITWNPKFTYSTDYMPLWDQTQDSPALFVWGKYANLEGIPAEKVCFGKEYNLHNTARRSRNRMVSPRRWPTLHRQTSPAPRCAELRCWEGLIANYL